MADMGGGGVSEVNFQLLAELSTKPHPLLHIAEDFEAQICGIPIAWTGEVFQEARNSHHLLDMAGIPHGKGYERDLDARTWRAITLISDLQERLERIADWHSRMSAPGGMFDDYCNECREPWPCDTRRMAEGTYVDDPEPDVATDPRPPDG